MIQLATRRNVVWLKAALTPTAPHEPSDAQMRLVAVETGELDAVLSSILDQAFKGEL